MRIIRETFYVLLCVIVLAGCTGKGVADSDGTKQEKVQDQEAEESVRAETEELADGIYTAEFRTDSSMFHVNEACGGRGTLTVENGEMTIHISLASKNIVNLYPGSAADARNE